MSLVQRVALSTSTAIQQRVISGQHFDGTIPNVAGVANDSPFVGMMIYKYAPASNGGLFFWNINEAVICGQFHIDLGGAADFSLYLVNLNPASDPTNPTPLSGERFLIEQQSGIVFAALDEARFKTVILPGQALQLITTASGAAQAAQAVASIERTYIR